MSAAIIRVIDGDTAEMRLTGGKVERVRFIGVDAPESNARFGTQATTYAKGILTTGRKVYLETDVDERDRYGRLLAYVWLSRPATVSDDLIGRRMFNSLLLTKGWAQILTISPNVNYVNYFTTFQDEAQAAERGIWKPEPPDDGGGDCDPSYPDVCIPSPPPDLNCPDISYRNFRVVGADPHRFDGDNDGIGCET